MDVIISELTKFYKSRTKKKEAKLAETSKNWLFWL